MDTRAAAYMKLQKLSGRIHLMENIVSLSNQENRDFDEELEPSLKELSETMFNSSESEDE